MKRILTTVFCLLFLLAAQAQQKPITGIVKDSKGEPVPFATIVETGTKKAVTADQNGRFTIRVAEGTKLTITSSGYEAQTAPAKEGMTVMMGSANNSLSEVVVTAFGVRRQPKELGYSISKISGDDAMKGRAVNIQNGLTGKVSGLTIQTVNNGVFADTRITLRGIRSLTGNNQPLLVVDGAPMDLNFINSINPNDVQDVTLLKGNTGAALYGQDGGNGVIIITTKGGSRGKPVITVGTTFQRESLAYLPKVQREFGNGEGENADGTPRLDVWTNNSYGPRYDGSEVDLGDPLPDGSIKRVKYAAQSKTPIEQFFRPTTTLQNDVSISGGDDKGRYYIGLRDVKVKGLIPNDENRRTTIRLNASRDFGKLSTAFRISYIRENFDIVNQRAGADNIYTSLFKTAAHVPISEFKDWRHDKFSTPDGYYNRFGLNPWMLLDIDRSKGRGDELIGSLEANLKVLNGLTLNYRLSTTISNNITKSWTGAINFNDPHSQKAYQTSRATVVDGAGYAARLNSEAFVTYKKQFNKLSTDALVGYSVINRIVRRQSTAGNNLVIPELYNVSNRTGEAIASEFNSEIRTAAAFGKVSLGWDDWAFLELTGRNEWDSRLSLNKNSFFYPGASLSVLLHEVLPQFKTSTVSYLKVRAAWAMSGSVNLEPYSLESAYFPSGRFPYGNLAGYTAGGTINNENIKPEYVNGKEAGVEIGFLNNKVMLEATYYHQTNTDQIINVQLSTATGYSTALVNAAAFVNKGVELDLKLTPLIKVGKDFQLDVKANYTLSDNKVTRIYEGLDELGLANNNFAIVGLPAFTFKLTDFARTPDGKVIVDRVTGLPSVDPLPRTYGRTLPKHQFGITPSIRYKDFSLSIVADYRGGHFIYNGLGSNLVFQGNGAMTTQYDRKPFIFPNSAYDDGTGKFVENKDVLTNGGSATFWTSSVMTNTQSQFYTSADSWKLREVALSYEVPASLLERTKVIKSAVVTLSGRNLLMWVPKSNIYTDPEFSNTTGNAQGVNNTYNTPPTRILGASLNLTF
ncbi:SusC/RagA family TonB-linked outer membrane protein [Paraflavitalea sp. CAU 1676]|uniref:SusC/RagA family TonB-linked outer membrane protein n=1 Tax=Paraflavitalea sp. CAU 1676 TaxID=3032598 RepID=UPI0023DBCE13|nr:SusC/RagA family TonB-linked outer membrane protein [Paraflavitalea sp. CAU 1676]MDF2193356.1 SusC/RagA family TonB-linked outer membrane protein [Paraflavitalea sp. CAU 1676]